MCQCTSGLSAKVRNSLAGGCDLLTYCCSDGGEHAATSVLAASIRPITYEAKRTAT